MPHKSLKLTQYEKIILICSAHLPWETDGVGVTIELLKEDEILVGRCVLLIKEYEVLITVSKNGNKDDMT